MLPIIAAICTLVRPLPFKKSQICLAFCFLSPLIALDPPLFVLLLEDLLSSAPPLTAELKILATLANADIKDLDFGLVLEPLELLLGEPDTFPLKYNLLVSIRDLFGSPLGQDFIFSLIALIYSLSGGSVQYGCLSSGNCNPLP